MEKQTYTILVIEDEEQIGQNIREILELSGYRVLVANCGGEGLQLVRNQAPDAVVCDIMMPDTDGYEVLAALQQDTAASSVPFIFLTAKADNSDRRQGMTLGADDYLTKPFSPQELTDAIAARLARRATYREGLAKDRQELKSQQQTAQRTLEKIQDVANVRGEILNRLVADLANPVSNINIAIRMLQGAETQELRDRYLKVLQEECAREMHLLSEASELQNLLTPENAAILQKFNLLAR